MRPTNPWLAALILSCLCAALPAEAEEGDWSLLVSPGYAVPVGRPGQGDEFHSRHAGSFHILTSVSYEVEEGGWVGAEFGYSTGHRFKGIMNTGDLDGDGLRDSAVFDSDIRTSFLHLTPFVKVGGPLNSFLGYHFNVGAGLYHFWSNAGTASLSGTGSTGADLSATSIPFAGASNSFFGFNLGHGLGYEIEESFEIGLEIRYHLIFQPGNIAGIVIPGARLAYFFL